MSASASASAPALAAADRGAGADIDMGGPARIAGSTRARVVAGTPAGAALADQARGYAARETQAVGLRNFRGGEEEDIYLGGSALTAAMLFLLLLILV